MAIFKAFQSSESILKGFLRHFMASAHDIEDICQETVTRALEAQRSREIEEPRAFLFGVARNLVRKQLDRQSRSLIDFVSDFSSKDLRSNEPSVEQNLDGRQRMMMFTESVATLPSQCQRVFILKKVYGYSHKEIAAKLKISVSTVEKHAAAGLKRCMDEMEKRQEQGPNIVGFRRAITDAGS